MFLPYFPNPDMTINRRIRAVRFLVALVALAGGVSACAVRRPIPTVTPIPVAPGVVWKIEPYDMLKVRVYREPDLNGEPQVAPDGSAFITGVGRVHVAGLTTDSLESMLTTRYKTVLREPVVQVTMQRELTIYGQVRAPGVYAIDPASTVQNLLVRGGGTQAQAGVGDFDMTLETSRGERFSMPREARLGTLDIHRSDAIRMTDPSFFSRNATNITAAQVMASVITTLVSVIVIFTR